ncbi:MAG: FxsA family protein [Pseudomonadota bacterium]
MRLGFLLIFIAVPIAELALLIQLGGWIGLWPTLGLIIATAVIGTFLLRQQGVATLNKVIRSVHAGEAPVGPMVEGVLLIIAGAFLLTPGVLTDAIGAIFLVPPLRATIANRAVRYAIERGMVHVSGARSAGGAAAPDGGSRTGPRGGDTAGGASGPHDPGPDPRRGPRGRDGSGGTGPVIDGDFERLDETTVDPRNRRS